MRFSPLSSGFQRISWGEVVSVFLYLLYFPSYDVINDVIMSDADCTHGREPRSVAASKIIFSEFKIRLYIINAINIIYDIIYKKFKIS